MKLWLLHLVPNLRFGRWLSSVTLFAVFAAAFAWAGAFDPQRAAFGPALFFVCIFAYMPAIVDYTLAHSETALRSLAQSFPGAIDLSEELGRLRHPGALWTLAVFAMSLLFGALHNVVLAGSVGDVGRIVASGRFGVAVVAGTFGVWLVMTTALAAMIRNAHRFGRLSGRVSVDPLDTSALTPFGRIAVVSTLAVIGALSFFPLLLLNSGFTSAAFLPGFVGTVAPLAGIVARALWPLHRALRSEKQAQLATINRQIRDEVANGATAADARLTSLLVYRRELQQIPEWPVDVGIVTRFALYAIIPPLTWVGAALIENLVDVAIG